MGELKKLGITPSSRNTIKNILKEHGLNPGPKRGEGTWDEFLTQHAKTLWQCDFFTKSALTMKGFRDLYVLVFLHVETRRVWISPSTFHSDETWVKQQAVAFLEHAKDIELPPDLLMHDRDTKFTKAFDAGRVGTPRMHAGLDVLGGTSLILRRACDCAIGGEVELLFAQEHGDGLGMG